MYAQSIMENKHFFIFLRKIPIQVTATETSSGERNKDAVICFQLFFCFLTT